MYHPRLKGKHYDMGRHYGELLAKSGTDLSICEGKPAKSAFRTDTRLAWGMNKANRK